MVAQASRQAPRTTSPSGAMPRNFAAFGARTAEQWRVFQARDENQAVVGLTEADGNTGFELRFR